MEINQVKTNNRIQVRVETRGKDSSIEIYRGIVMDITDKEITLVTDYGKRVQLYRNDILSVQKFGFEKQVSQCVLKLKSTFSEREVLLDKLDKLEEREVVLKEELLDFNMLSSFNLLGATNRLNKSIDADLKEFSRGLYLYSIIFSAGEKENLEIFFKVSNVLEHYLNDVNIENLLKSHAPQEKELLQKIFDEFGTVENTESYAVHVEGNIYEVISKYRIRTKLTKDNYNDIKTKMVQGLKELRK